MKSLTELETKVIAAFNTNYDNAKSEIVDNATYTDVAELSERTGITVDSIKGVVGSLVKKGLVDVDTHKLGVPDCLVLTDEGIEMFYKC